MNLNYTYSNKWLLELIQTGRMPKYLFFWGHQSLKDKVTKTCFSQWYESPFLVDGLRYATAEHWMMAEKARLFKNHDIVEKILSASTAGAAKALGREVTGFKSDVWNAEKFEIVIQGNQHKFEQNTKMEEFLLGTGTRVLVEASPVDYIWGIGLSQDDPNLDDTHNWKGENLLGYALMETRDRLRN